MTGVYISERLDKVRSVLPGHIFHLRHETSTSVLFVCPPGSRDKSPAVVNYAHQGKRNLKYDNIQTNARKADGL